MRFVEIGFPSFAGKAHPPKMQYIEFVRELLASDYRTHLPEEIPYPNLEELIARNQFDFPSGNVVNQRENGAYSRDELAYQCFPDSDKRILVNRLIVAVALGKWPPRDLDVHQINAKPDDNRPEKLELVTRRQNNQVRRAPLRKVADLSKANQWVSSIPKIERKPTRKGARKSNSSVMSPDSPIEVLARLLERESGVLLSNNQVPPIEEVLRKYYSIPEAVSWTGKRKGKDDCYWEATSGTWYYVDHDH